MGSELTRTGYSNSKHWKIERNASISGRLDSNQTAVLTPPVRDLEHEDGLNLGGPSLNSIVIEQAYGVYRS